MNAQKIVWNSANAKISSTFPCNIVLNFKIIESDRHEEILHGVEDRWIITIKIKGETGYVDKTTKKLLIKSF